MKRIFNYLYSVLHLYLYGVKSKFPKPDEQNVDQKQNKSAFFLSKAGRFFTVGASGIIVNYTASFLMSNLVPNIWYMYATLFGIVISITSNFLLNKIWTFEDMNFSPKRLFRQYVFFLGICAFGAVIQLSFVYSFVEYFHFHYAISLFVGICVASISNFVLNKRITFGEKVWS